MAYLIWLFTALVNLGYTNIPTQHNCLQSNGTYITKPSYDTDCKDACYNWVVGADAKNFLDKQGFDDVFVAQ